jgi:uncharacterized membrane protein
MESLKSVTARLEALSDGIFGIAATLLVLEVKVPDLPEKYTQAEMVTALLKVFPSFLSFFISFLTILIYWVSHDSMTRILVKSNYRLTWLNLLLLFWIALIPFPTHFLSEYPTDLVAILTYGIVLLLTGITANVTVYYMFFIRPDLVKHSITHDTRVDLFRKYLMGPILYVVAIGLAFVHIYITLALYVLIPVIFFIPVNQEQILKEMGLEK